MHFSGEMDIITSSFAVTESHASTIEKTVSIFVDNLLLSNKTSKFYIVIDSADKNYRKSSFSAILLYIDIQENNFQ